MRGAVILLVVAACSSDGQQIAVDAGKPPPPPDTEPAIDPLRVPFEVTGTSPDGPFTTHYARFGWLAGDCMTGYYAQLTRSNILTDGGDVEIFVPRDFGAPAPTGVVPVQLWPIASTNPFMPVAGTFEVTQLDSITGEGSLRFAGRAVVNAEGWQVDVSIDQVVPGAVCI